MVDVEVDSDGAVIRLVGEIDLANADRLGQQLAGLLGPRDTQLDLTGVGYLDSAGLRMLIELSEYAISRAIAISLVVVRESMVDRVLALSGFDRLFSIRSVDPDAA